MKKVLVQKKSMTLTPAVQLAGWDVRVKRRNAPGYLLAGWNLLREYKVVFFSKMFVFILQSENMSLWTHMIDESSWPVEPRPDTVKRDFLLFSR